MKKNNKKRRRISTDQEVGVEAEVGKGEKNIAIVNRRKRKNIVQKGIKDLNKKIEIRRIKKKRNILVKQKMRKLHNKIVDKREKEIDHIVIVVIQAK